MKQKSCERVGHPDEHHICMRSGIIFVFYKSRYENASEVVSKDAKVFPVAPYMVSETSAASSLSWFVLVSIVYSPMKSL